MNPHRRLALSAVAAVLSLGAAIALVTTTPNPTEPIAQPTPTAPGAVWTVAAADVLGNEFATFEDPVGGRFGDVKGGVIDAGDVLITRAGLTNQETDERERSELIGLDSSTGVVRWKTAADDFDSCLTDMLGDMMLCRNATDVVTIDTSDGEVTRHPTSWQVLGMATDGQDIYVAEGAVDGYSVTVHRGTLDDMDARWSITLENTYLSPTDTTDFIEFAGDIGVARFSSGTALFDPETGDFHDFFSAPDCTYGSSKRMDEVLVLVGRNCSDLFEFRTDLVDSTGRIVAGVDRQVYQRMLVDAPIRPDSPVLLGGSVFDPTTGRELWAYDQSLNGGDYALIGDTLISDDGAPPQKLSTGEPAWGNEVQPLEGVPSALHNGEAYISGWTDIQAIDPATGERLRSIPVEGLIGNTIGRSQQVALQDTTAGVVVVNETKLNML